MTPPTEAERLLKLSLLLTPRNPRRVVCSTRARYDLFIGRPSLYGNPFVVGVHGRSKFEVVQMFKEHVESSPKLLALLPGIRGKILGCPCGGRPCHGDVWDILANS